jgi:hypothetical protein
MPTIQGSLELLNDPIAQELLRSNIPAQACVCLAGWDAPRYTNLVSLEWLKFCTCDAAKSGKTEGATSAPQGGSHNR